MLRTPIRSLLYLLLLSSCQPALMPPVPTPTSPPTPPRPTDIPDSCAGATDAGARQRFTLEQITPCLDEPAKVGAFMVSNMTYDTGYDLREHGENEYAPAATVFERGIDDADGYAILMCYFLEKNGWDAFVLGLSIETPNGSNVCGYNENGQLFTLAGGGRQEGSFDSWSALMGYYSSKGWMRFKGSIRKLHASQVVRVTTVRTSPGILDLPWEMQEY